MRDVRGLAETLVRSSRDGTMQPVSVYVPATYSGARAAPLMLLLHGRPQSESQLLAPDFLHKLADATGTILVAPWGRGYYDFRGSSSDVYDALHAALDAFRIDGRKKYLAGYSMGGFSVFEVATAHPMIGRPSPASRGAAGLRCATGHRHAAQDAGLRAHGKCRRQHPDAISNRDGSLFTRRGLRRFVLFTTGRPAPSHNARADSHASLGRYAAADRSRAARGPGRDVATGGDAGESDEALTTSERRRIRFAVGARWLRHRGQAR